MVQTRHFGTRDQQRNKLGFKEMKCLISNFVVSRSDRVRNEEFRRRVGMREKTSDRIDLNILK